MKFIVSSTQLAKKLQSVNGAILAKPVIPALENFYFNIKDGKLQITATDLETFLQDSIDVQSNENISICVPAKDTLTTLGKLGDQPITFSVNPDNLSIDISITNGRYTLAGASGDEFPSTPEIEVTNTFTLPSNALLRAINKTLFATGNDELRLALTGIFFELAADSFNVVATDANRMVRYLRKDIKPGFETNFILPKKSMNLLKTGLPNDESPVTVDISNSNVKFTCGDFVVIARVMEEKFPDYKMVIPNDNNNILNINRAELLRSVDRIGIFSNQSTHQIRLKITGSELNIMSEDIEKAKAAHETLNCDFDGEDLEIGFNAKFLWDILSNLDGEEVSLKFSSPARAGLAVPKDNEADEDVLMLIMPMMLNSYAN